MKSIYYHIPKCGGTSIGYLARLNLKKDYILSVYQNNPKSNLGVLRKTEKSGFERKSFLKSHVPYGSLMSCLDVPCFTFLRNPERRLESLIDDIATRKTHYLHEKIGKCNSNLEEILDQLPLWETDNSLIRYLVGERGFSTEKITEDDLATAKENLIQKMDWFGLQESFNDSLIILKDRLGWKYVYDIKTNKGDGNRSSNDWSTERLYPYVKYDLELYETAKKAFKEQLKDCMISTIPVLQKPIEVFFFKCLIRLRALSGV